MQDDLEQQGDLFIFIGTTHQQHAPLMAMAPQSNTASLAAAASTFGSDLLWAVVFPEHI
jgi:hypothetical protein